MSPSGTRPIALLAPRGTIDRVAIARTFGARCIGLLARAALQPGEGLLLVPGGSIHTWGMRFAIDVIFLSERLEVLDLAASVRPWRFVIAPRGTRFVLELRDLATQDLAIVRGCALHPVANCKQLSHGACASRRSATPHRLNCDLNLTS